MLIVTDSNGVPSVASWVRVDSTANLTPGTLSGQVTDRASGNLVQGATVSESGGTPTTTDASGNYTLAGVLPGDKLVTISQSGYATVSKTKEVIGGQTSTLDVALGPPGTINGKVTDSSTGGLIADATILYDGGSTTTNGSGNYTIIGVPAGSQALIASADGYQSSSAQNVTVPANSSVTANIALTPKPTFIAGEVRDSITGQTIADVTISAGGLDVTTDSLGRYQIFVPPGIYNVAGSIDGYFATVHSGVIVTFGTYTAADLSLTPMNPPVTFAPTADTYANEALPTVNNGTNATFSAFATLPNSPENVAA